MQCKLYKYSRTLIMSIISYKVTIKSNNLSIFHIMNNLYPARSNVKKKNYATSEGLTPSIYYISRYIWYWYFRNSAVGRQNRNKTNYYLSNKILAMNFDVTTI
jgi:hypothetical protein